MVRESSVFIKIRLAWIGKLGIMALQARYDSSFAARDAFAELFRIGPARLIEFLSLLAHHCHVVLAWLRKLGIIALQARPDSAAARFYPLAEFFYIGFAGALVHARVHHLRGSDNRD